MEVLDLVITVWSSCCRSLKRKRSKACLRTIQQYQLRLDRVADAHRGNRSVGIGHSCNNACEKQWDDAGNAQECGTHVPTSDVDWHLGVFSERQANAACELVSGEEGEKSIDCT